MKCPECRDGKPWNCAGFAFDENDDQVACEGHEPTGQEQER